MEVRTLSYIDRMPGDVTPPAGHTLERSPGMSFLNGCAGIAEGRQPGRLYVTHLTYGGKMAWVSIRYEEYMNMALDAPMRERVDYSEMYGTCAWQRCDAQYTVWVWRGHPTAPWSTNVTTPHQYAQPSDTWFSVSSCVARIHRLLVLHASDSLV